MSSSGVKKIRAGMGLGDALYLQSVVRHLVSKGQRLQVACQWGDVFKPLGDAVKMVPFTRQGIQILAHYSLRKGKPETNQFQDCCIQAGITEPVEMRLDWEPSNLPLIEHLRSFGKPILCVQLPRSPMGRTDGFGAELLPDCRVIQQALNLLRTKYLIVQIGSGKPLYHFEGIDLDLANRTTVSDLLDIAWAADAFLGYCSFIIPLAESFTKPCLLVWSSRGLKSGHPFINRITPKKIISKPSCRWVRDDQPEKLAEALHDFL